MKLSIAMIVKDEEKNLDRTLKALSCLNNKIDYEIVIVDTGSTDKTIEIAKKYTNRVYQHQWTGIFAEMRNISINYCTGEWVLILDADEVLENADELLNFLNSEKGELFNSATVEIKNYNRNSNQVTTKAALIRLLRNSKDLKYKGRVHEQPVFKLPLAHTEISFKHYGYCADDYELMNYKFERNEKLLQEELKEAKGDYEIYVLFQLSKTYSMADKPLEALNYIKMAYDKEIKRKSDTVHTYVFHWYASVLFNRCEYEKSIKICKQFEEDADENLDIYYMMAVSYSALEKYDLAYEYYDKYFELRKRREQGEYSDDISLSEGSYDNYYRMLSNRIVCYYKEKKYDKVISEFEENYSDEFARNIKNAYISSCVIQGSLNRIIKYFEDKKMDDTDIDEVIVEINSAVQEGKIKNIKDVKEDFSRLDNRLKIYFSCMHDNNYDEGKEVDYSIYANWKKEVLKKLVLHDCKNIELIMDVNNEVIKFYIEQLCKDFKCVDEIYNYAESKFLTCNVKKLNFISNIENVLVFCKSIVDDKYKKLVLRVLCNRNLFRRLVFNNEILSKDELRAVLNEYDKIWFDMTDYLGLYHEDKLEYVRKLVTIIHKNKIYSSVIKVFENEVTDKPVSPEMIQEKDNVFSIVENMISSNKIKEAEDILLQLEEMFKWDGKLFDFKGVINYLKEEYDDALLNFGLAEMLMEDKFDPLFNIACIMEKQGRILDAKKYYEQAYKMCGDDNMKAQIQDIIKGLN